MYLLCVPVPLHVSVCAQIQLVCNNMRKLKVARGGTCPSFLAEEEASENIWELRAVGSH